MARSTGIVGFETGWLEGSWMTQVNCTLVDNGTARTGRFYARTFGAGFGNFQIETVATLFPAIGFGDSGDIRFRSYYRCATRPAGGDRNVMAISGGNAQHATAILEMNSTGNVRMTVSGVGSTAYGAQLALDRWYEIQIRIHGTITAASPTTPNANVIHDIDIYEEDGTLVQNFTLVRDAFPNSLWLVQSSNCVFGPFEFGAPNRDWHYDDIFYDWTTHADADLSRPWPRHNKVEPFPILSQGALDAFTPAGAFDRVDEIPWVEGGGGDDFVATPTLNAATQYVKAGSIDVTDECEYARIYGYIIGGGSTQSILWNGEELSVVTGAGVLGAFENNVDARRSYLYPASPLSGAAFNAAQYGLRKTSPAGASLELRAQILEALIGPRVPPPPVEGCPDNFPSDLSGGASASLCAIDFPVDSDPVV